MVGYRCYNLNLIRCVGLFVMMVLLYQTYLIARLRIGGQEPTVEIHRGISAFSQGREYNSLTHPFIFIGGHPRSGTTLLRAMLDSHHKVRCGEETRIIPRILQLRDQIFGSTNEKQRLAQGGITADVIDAAVTAFIMESIVQHGEAADNLCNKDPLTLKNGDYLTRIFPRSKWIFMLRDGRAVVHSVIKRHITITGYEHDDPRACLEKWNDVVDVMDQVCSRLGEDKCLRVKYEELVLHPRREIAAVLRFLDIPWNNSVLSHHKMINQPGGVRVSNMERSSDQIIQPVHTKALTEWVGTFSKKLLRDMDKVAPMLKKLGYNPNENPPKYGEADPEILNNTRNVDMNQEYWSEKRVQMLKDMEKPDMEVITPRVDYIVYKKDQHSKL